MDDLVLHQISIQPSTPIGCKLEGEPIDTDLGPHAPIEETQHEQLPAIHEQERFYPGSFFSCGTQLLLWALVEWRDEHLLPCGSWTLPECQNATLLEQQASMKISHVGLKRS